MCMMLTKASLSCLLSQPHSALLWCSYGLDELRLPQSSFPQVSPAVPVMLSKRVPLANFQDGRLVAQIRIQNDSPGPEWFI